MEETNVGSFVCEYKEFNGYYKVGKVLKILDLLDALRYNKTSEKVVEDIHI